MWEYPGDFELHLTVRAADESALGRFQEWCRTQGFKCARIVLAQGEHVEQPLATWRCQATRLSQAMAEISAAAARLAAADLPVVRLKIEAAPDNAETPETDADAPLHPAANYFEHHLKLLRLVGARTEALVAVCQRHGAHLSRNAFRLAADGSEERFVTLRSYGVGRATAALRWQQLLADVTALGERVLKHESEYCVYDSNLALDAGWLSGASAARTYHTA
jgi:hypothetical protein